MPDAKSLLPAVRREEEGVAVLSCCDVVFAVDENKSGCTDLIIFVLIAEALGSAVLYCYLLISAEKEGKPGGKSYESAVPLNPSGFIPCCKAIGWCRGPAMVSTCWAFLPK